MTERRLSVLVNGRFLTQPLTGVQRYGLEIVRQLEKNFALARNACGIGPIHPEFRRKREMAYAT